jgi:cephalosporin hydroxylase
MSKTNKIIDEAYSLYMPQIRSEITALYEYVMQHKANTPGSYNILEIGTKYGGTFYLWASVNFESGMNISIDMSDGGLHGGISDEEMDKRDLWFQERFGNVSFIRGDSHDESTLWTVRYWLQSHRMNLNDRVWDRSTFDERGIDFLFIDGDHTKKGVQKDFEMYSPFVKKGGIVAFHDIVISDHHHSRDVYVGEFWNELKASGKYECIEFVEEGNNWGGIGVVILK